MAERIVLHVGPHKTGSTALQKAFAKASGELAACGVLYPVVGRTGEAHQDVARACWVADSPVLPELTRELSDCRMAFMSSELFAALDPTGLRRLASALGDATIEIIYVLRRLPELLPSHWRELVKHGNAMDFDGYLVLAADPKTPQYLSAPLPVRQLDRLTAVFGTGGLRLAVYDARSGARDRYGPDFIDDVFGLGHLADRFETRQMNLTSPHWQVELVRQMNLRAGAGLSYARKYQLRRMLLELLAAEPPEWIGDFRAAFDAAPAHVLAQDTPLIAAEVAGVLERYADYLLDPPESYTAPVVAEVRALGHESMDPALAREVAALFDRLAAALPEEVPEP